jgi:iron transport multicopper oxidase
MMQMIKSSNFHWPGQPYRLLVNGMTNFNMSLSYNKTYLIRFIGATAHSYLNISFPGHNMTIVEVEGTYTNPVEIQHLWINSGERYTVLLKANNPGCYWVNISSMSDPINVLIGLTYDNIDCNNVNYISTINNNFFNTSLLTSKYPVDLPKPNKNLSIYMNVYKLNPNYRIFTYNNVSTELPNIPILLSYYLGTYVANNKTLILNVNNGDVIDIQLINHAKFQHVTHCHSVSFYVLNSDNPIKRDTVTTESGETTLIRVSFDNPGCWLVHCHSSKHHEMGLIMAFCYDPKTIPRPPDDFTICSKTFGEIKRKRNLLNTIYSLGTGIILMILLSVIISIIIYKKKKLEEERMRLIV